MHSAALLDQLAVLAAAPGGLDRLKQTVLTLAMQGKLVEQDPADEPARVLLERIRAEKQCMIDAGQLKQDKPLPPIGADEMPYSLPAGWEWVRVGNVSTVKSSKRIYEADYTTSGVPFFRSKEIGELSRKQRVETEICISKEKYEEIKNSFGVPEKGDLLITSVGSIGNTWISDGREFYYKDGNITQIVNRQNISMQYVQKYIQSPLFSNQVMDSVSGTAYNALTIIKLNRLIIPLPPLLEQHRIVAKIEQLFALCESLIKQQSRQERRRGALGRSLRHHLAAAPDADSFAHSRDRLLQHFDLVHADVADIADLRQTILTLALQGKLVEQNPADEPAGELLERIRVEKQCLIAAGQLKKDKPLPPIGAEEMPYSLPMGWEWVRLGEIGQINPRNQCEDQIEVSFIPMALISEKYFCKHGAELRVWSDVKSGFTHLAEEDVVLAKITPCFENGKAAVMKNLSNGIGAGTTELHVFRRITADVLPVFIYTFFKTPRFVEDGKLKMTGTAGQQRVSKEYVQNSILGMPPLAEQHRIVAKIEQLFSLCDALEAALRCQDKRQQRLLASVCHHLTEPVVPA